MECSAKEDINIKSVFSTLVTNVYQVTMAASGVQPNPLPSHLAHADDGAIVSMLKLLADPTFFQAPNQHGYLGQMARATEA